MMCQRIGLPPISTIGFGRCSVSSASRVPIPPASIATFIQPYSQCLVHVCRAEDELVSCIKHDRQSQPRWNQSAGDAICKASMSLQVGLIQWIDGNGIGLSVPPNRVLQDSILDHCTFLFRRVRQTNPRHLTLILDAFLTSRPRFPRIWVQSKQKICRHPTRAAITCLAPPPDIRLL